MVAITAWLEAQPPADEVRDELEAVDPAVAPGAGLAGPGGGLAGLVGLGQTQEELDLADQGLREAVEGAAKAHQQLAALVVTRSVVLEKLQDRRMCVEIREGEPRIVLDRPIDYQTALTTATGTAQLRHAPIFSWTSKMTAPSWSLPAGAPNLGGACPGASFGQSVVGFDKVKTALSRVNGPHQLEGNRELLEEWHRLHGTTGATYRWLAHAICQHCYATGSGYSYTSQVAASALRYAWCVRALQTPGADGFETLFEEVMVKLLSTIPSWHDAEDCTTRTVLNEKTGKKEKQRVCQGTEPEDFRDWLYFRIHDSGDFFAPEYFKAWKRIAQHFTGRNGGRKILFWAPTRMWVFDRWVRLVNEVNDPPENFVVRPSAYLINVPVPKGPERNLGPGWAGWTVVYRADLVEEAQRKGSFDVNCPAFSVKDDYHTCRKATRPELVGGPTRGCRVCWRLPKATVNYKLH